MSSRSRSSSRSSTNRNLTPNGRKRRLNSQTSLSKASTSQSSSKKTTSNKRSKEPDFSPSTKRRRLSTQSSDCQPGPSGARNYFPSVESYSEEEEEEPEGEKHPIYLHAAMATPSPGGHLNNKTNSFRNHKTGIGAGTNNHAKKTGGSKKLVIKNRKCKFVYMHCMFSTICVCFLPIMLVSKYTRSKFISLF